MRVTPDLAVQCNLLIDHGILIASVVKHGPADRAGLKPGGIIVKVGAKQIASETDLLDALANENPGQVASSTLVDQQGKQHAYRIKLGEFQASSNGLKVAEIVGESDLRDHKSA